MAFPLTPKYMTLNDLNGHFTLNFHYYAQPFENLFYMLTVELVYIT